MTVKTIIEKYLHPNEAIIEKLKWAVNLYSQAGDTNNTRRQYRKLADEARSIIINEVVQILGVQIDDNAEIAAAEGEMKTHTDCIFYEKDIDDFGGCPHFWKESSDWGECCYDCPYRLERVMGIVRAAERYIETICSDDDQSIQPFFDKLKQVVRM